MDEYYTDSTYYTEDEYKNVVNKIYREIYNRFNQVVCLLPETSRLSMTITVSKKITDQNILYKSITESLQEQFINSKVYVLSIRSNQDKLYRLEMGISDINLNTKPYIYDIIYLVIPNKLISNFEKENVHCVKYYVGKSINNNEYKILNKAPTLDMISSYMNSKPVPFSYTANLT